MSAMRVAGTRPVGARSWSMDACMLPVAWLLAVVAVCAITAYDFQVHPSHVPGAATTSSSSWPQQLQHPVELAQVFNASGAGPFGQMHSLLMHKQSSWQRSTPLGSFSLKAVAAHPGDLGLAAAVFLPQLLLALLVASVLRKRPARVAPEHRQDPADGQAVTTPSTAAAAGRTVTGLLYDTGSMGPATYLAIAKLLPLVCSMLVILAGCCGLRGSNSTSQALQLLHPLTPLLTATMTFLSQAGFIQTLAVAVTHLVLAGVALATYTGPRLHHYFSPAQSWLALAVLDVLLPAALALWRCQSARSSSAASSVTATSSVARNPQSTESAPRDAASTSADDSAGVSGAQSAQAVATGLRRRAAQAAAEPASPAPPTVPVPHGLTDESSRPFSGHHSPGSCPDVQLSDAPAVEATATGAESQLVLSQPPSCPTVSTAEFSLLGPTCTPPAPAAHFISAGWHVSADLPDAPHTMTTPVMDFEEALAACARGVAARKASGVSPATALYHSQLHHHVVSIKAPLDAALEGQELMQLVLDQLKRPAASPRTTFSTGTPLQGGAAASSPLAVYTTAASTAYGPTSPQRPFSGPAGPLCPMMLRPVAMRGCLHVLLPLCLHPGVPAAMATPTAAMAADNTNGCALHMPVEKVLERLIQDRSLYTSSLSAAKSSQHQGSSTSQGPGQDHHLQLCFQVDQSEPLLLTAAPDGSWQVTQDRDSTDAASSALPTNTTSCEGAIPTVDSSNSNSRTTGTQCWLEPPCVLLRPYTSSGSSRAGASPVSAVSPAKGFARPCVTVMGLSAAAGALVRVLVVQGPAVVADQLLPVVQLGSPRSAQGAQEGGPGRSVRLTLPATSLQAGPAMVCILAPPRSVAAAGSTAAGVSPAMAALGRSHSTSPSRIEGHAAAPSCSTTTAGNATPLSAEELKSARMWACLPLLLVDEAQAQEELSMLFVTMCSELDQQQQATPEAAGSLQGSGHTSTAASVALVDQHAGPSSSTAQQAYNQHWQPLLWDWLFATQGADTASIAPGCLTQLAAQSKDPAYTPAVLSGGLYERATVSCMQSTTNNSSSSHPAVVFTRQAIVVHLLELFVDHGLSAAIKQLQASAAKNADTLATAGLRSPSQGAPAVVNNGSSTSPTGLPPHAPSRHDSCDSYNQLSAAGPTPSRRPPVHCKDMIAPGMTLKQKQLQQPQQKYIQTLEPPVQSQHSPQLQHRALQQQHQQSPAYCVTPGESGLLPAWRGSNELTPPAVPATSAGLFDRYRHLSLDSLPLPAAPGAPATDLHPPRWSVDLTSLQHQQQQLQVSPPTVVGSSLIGSMELPPQNLQGTAASAAAAAAGAAAAQAALMRLHPGGFNSSPGSLPSPAVQMGAPGSASRFSQQASPLGGSAMSHLHPQPSLGYSPSLASTNSASTSVFMTADASGAVGAGPYGLPIKSPTAMAGTVRSSSVPQGAGPVEPASLEGRHWAVFDTTGLEGYDPNADTTAGTNLVSTMVGRRSSANSVTWLAIPTSHTGLGLPPTALRTPRTSRHSGALYSSSTGKLRRSEQQRSVSSTLTPQPPRSQSLSRHTALSADYFGGSTSSGTLSMPQQSHRNRHSTRTSLFSPGSSGGSIPGGGGAGSQHETAAFSPDDLSPPAHPSHLANRHVGGFNTPKRRGPVRFVGSSPSMGGPWSPAGQLYTMPTIGSEDSWDQNAQHTPSPVQGTAKATPLLRDRTAQEQRSATPGQLPPHAQAGGLTAASWGAAVTPGPPGGNSSSGRAPPVTPRSVSRLPAGVMAATPRAGMYRSQQGSMTPAYYASRTGNLLSGNALAAGDEGDTVSGVLNLLGPTEPSDSRLAHHHSAALSGFSSSSGSLASTPDAPYGLLQGSFQGGYFTPVRPKQKNSAAAALLPGSARPASRPAAWATPAASGRNIPAGVSGSFSTVGVTAPNSTMGAGAGQQVPDTPLLKAGRNIAGVMFSPAPPAPLTLQQQQARMSTPSHIQSLLPPPGSASKLKPAAALLSSAVVSGSMTPTRPSTSSSSSSSGLGQQQSSAAAAAALLQLSPPALGSVAPWTPSEPEVHTTPSSSGMCSSSSMFHTQLTPLYEDDGADMVTPCDTPRAGSPVGSPFGAGLSGCAAGLSSGGVHSGASRLPCSPPPAPARPVPGVVLVPAVEAESLYSSDDCEPEMYDGDVY